MSNSGAVQVDFLLAGLGDANGDPLSSGKVYTYAAGTTDLKATWTDEAKTTPAPNPIILTSNGNILIYAEGEYKFNITDSADNQMYGGAWDNLSFFKHLHNTLDELT